MCLFLSQNCPSISHLCPFYLLVHTELFVFIFWCNINVLSLWNDFSLSHDVLFLQNCALSFVFVHFSNNYRLLTFLLCVLMQYKCPFHETYCPLSQVCPFSSQLRWLISLSLTSSNFLVFHALFLVSINSILPFSLCLFRMCACFF